MRSRAAGPERSGPSYAGLARDSTCTSPLATAAVAQITRGAASRAYPVAA